MADITRDAEQAKAVEPAAQPLKVPRVVKRNTLLFVLSQAFVGSGMQMYPALGPLAMLKVTGTASLAGLSTSILGVSRFLVAYPAGKISDRFGRKPTLMLGLVFGLAGAVFVGLSIVWGSFPLLVASMLVYGMGMGAAQQLRVAAADMYPPKLRGLGTGYVLSGSLIGVLIAPIIVATARSMSPRLGIDELGLPWFFVPVVIVPAMLLVFLVKPDPKEIAANLEAHYPGYKAPPRTAAQVQSKMDLLTFVRHYPKLTASMCSFAVQGNMNMMMFLTSLVLHDHGYDLPVISAAVSIHVFGMYGFSMPLGWLTDRLGRRAVMIVGVFIAALGALLVPSSSAFWVITTGTFLVGLGWSCGHVAATALVADTSEPEVRGKAIGAMDTVTLVPAIILPLLAGPMADTLGFRWVGILGMSLMIVPFFLLMKLREPTPGRYVWGPRETQRT